MERKLTVVVVALRGGENVKMKTGKKKKREIFMVTGVCEGSQDPSQGSLVIWKKNVVSCMHVGCR